MLAGEYLERAALTMDYQMDSFLQMVRGIIHSSTLASSFEMVCTGFEGPSDDALEQHTEDIVKMLNSIVEATQSKITALPNDYISIQLERDVESVVKETGSADECASKLQRLITDRMKDWTDKPQASAYCYGHHLGGWGYHAVIHSSAVGNKSHGFYKKFRVLNKFCVGVDWTSSTSTYDDIDTGAIKEALEETLVPFNSCFLNSCDGNFLYNQKDDEGIQKVKEIVQSTLVSSLKVRNIAYVSGALSPSVSSWPGKQYQVDIDLWEG